MYFFSKKPMKWQKAVFTDLAHTKYHLKLKRCIVECNVTQLGIHFKIVWHFLYLQEEDLKNWPFISGIFANRGFSCNFSANFDH